MKKAFFISCLVLFTLFFAPFKFYAAEEAKDATNDAEVIKLYLGEVKTLQVKNPIRIAIGNPDIIDVNNVTKNELTLVPKKAGATSFVYWDGFGENSFKVRVFTDNIQDIKLRIDNLLATLELPKVYTRAEEDEGKVLLLGSVKVAADKEKISLALGPLKEKTIDLLAIKEEDAAVEIDVQVLELTKDAQTTLGLTSPNGVSITEVGSAAISAGGTSVGSLFRMANFQRGAFNWTLDALASEGKARVLSRPKLACQSGKEAELSVGGEVPTFTTNVASAGGQGTSVDYKSYGLKCKIKPIVTADKRIKISLNTEISEVQAAQTIGAANAPTAMAYPLTKRNISTELFMDNGQTLAIGGLLKQKEEEDIAKTWGLGDIPVIGLMFRHKVAKSGGGSGARGNMELFITLTPTIIGYQENAPAKPQGNTIEAMPGVSFGNAAGKVSAPLENYVKIIQKRILDNVKYPTTAKNAKAQGTAKLKLHLAYTGQLIDVLLQESSGYKVLDDSAINVAKRMVNYPPFPPSIEEKDLWVDIPISYRLD